MAVRCPIHTDEIYEGASTRAEHRLHPENGCSKCLAEKNADQITDPAAALLSAQQRQSAAKAQATVAARRAAEARAEAEKFLREAADAEKEAASILGPAPVPDAA